MSYERNEWLQLNKRKIDSLQYRLTEAAYKNENTGLPIPEIKAVIEATITEIKKLQVKIDALTSTVNKLQPNVEGTKKE